MRNYFFSQLIESSVVRAVVPTADSSVTLLTTSTHDCMLYALLNYLCQIVVYKKYIGERADTVYSTPYHFKSFSNVFIRGWVGLAYTYGFVERKSPLTKNVSASQCIVCLLYVSRILCKSYHFIPTSQYLYTVFHSGK